MPALSAIVLFKSILAPFWVKVPDVDSITSSIFIVPEDNWRPFELSKVNFLKLFVPEPEIDWEEEPLKVILLPAIEELNVALLVQSPLILKSESQDVAASIVIFL